MKYKKKKLEIFFFGIVLPVVGYFVIFYRSDAPPLFIWDEASYATNALEMVLSNDYISLRRHDGITLYSTKLPLVIWLQSLCIRIFGINELAIRLPSLLAGSGTVFMLVFFGKKVLRSSIIGFFSGLTLLASFAFMNNHIVRSGDLDAMLTFFITLYSLLLFTFLLKKETDFNSFLPWLSFAIIAAFYTKSIAGFMPLLGLFFTGVTSTRRKEIFSNYKTYLYGWVVLVICGAYYYVREKAAAGYLDKIFYSEYSRMTENVMPYHNKHFIYYVRRMGVERFYPFIYFIPFALWLGAKSKTEII
ncbi:MAG TPA: hypothetical protein ENJ53_06825, partial [Phaeodactylibacter sp.]|nr:hypothetical protein [Phaeodactylibacter sp.]